MLVRALLDTGSEWCVLATDVAASLGCDLTQGELPLHTRFGTIWGSLGRLPLRFESAEGQSLELEATWFISADWPGPTVIGWKGGLERLRFALNPGDDTFYFGEL